MECRRVMFAVLRAQECQVPFGNGNFFEHDGLPYCETHFHAHRGSLCAGCHKPVTGRCITAMYRKYHPEHFVCSFCQCQLNKGTFKEEKDKPYCHPCFVRLFSWLNTIRHIPRGNSGPKKWTRQFEVLDGQYDSWTWERVYPPYYGRTVGR